MVLFAAGAFAGSWFRGAETAAGGGTSTALPLAACWAPNLDDLCFSQGLEDVCCSDWAQQTTEMIIMIARVWIMGSKLVEILGAII